MSLHAAYTRYLIAKIEAGDCIEGYHLEMVPWRTVSPCYRLHFGSDSPRPLYLGTEEHATQALNNAAETVRLVAARMKEKETRLSRFLSRI